MLIFRLFSFLMISICAFSASHDTLLHFEEDVRTLNYIHPDGRVFVADRFDAENLEHYEAAKVLDAQSNSDPFSSASSLLPLCPQWYRESGKEHEAALLKKLRSSFAPTYPLDQYLLFLKTEAEKVLVGTFGLSFPKAFEEDINYKEIMDALSQWQGQEQIEEEEVDSEGENFAPNHAEITLFISEQHRGARLGFVVMSMIHHLIDSALGKSLFVPRFDSSRQTFSNVWTMTPLKGCQSYVSATNIASMDAHLQSPNDVHAPEKVQAVDSTSAGAGWVRFLYPKGEDASDREMESLKLKIKAAKEAYKLAQSVGAIAL